MHNVYKISFFLTKAIKSDYEIDCTSIIHQLDLNEFASKWLAAGISVVLHNSFPVSSPCRKGFCSRFLPHCLGATLTMATWVFVTLLSLLSALCSSYLLHQVGRSVWHYSVSGERREMAWKIFEPFAVCSQSSIWCEKWFSASWQGTVLNDSFIICQVRYKH